MSNLGVERLALISSLISLHCSGNRLTSLPDVSHVHVYVLFVNAFSLVPFDRVLMKAVMR